MLLNDGKELPFWIDSLPCDSKNCLYLTHIGNDRRGMKFTGAIPFLWENNGGKIMGPNLYDDNRTYRVIEVDYHHNCIWLEEF